MTATYDDYTGNNSNKNFTYNFPVLLSTDVKVSVDGVTQTSGYTVNTGNTRVEFTTAPALNAKVRVYRDTATGKTSGDGDPKAVFAAGSSVRAVDLNNNFEQLLFATHEIQNQPSLAEDIEDDAVTRSKIKADAVNGDKIADDSIDSEHVAADSLDSEHYAPGSVDADALGTDSVVTAKIQNDAVTMAKLGSGALPTDITVASANIVNNTIVDADVNSSAAIAGTKVNPNFGSQAVATSGTLASGAATVTGNITVSGTVDGRDVAADGTKLDGIESNATADQSNAEIRAAVEAASDSNVFTDADHTKLNGIDTGATDDQTAAEIKTLLQSDKITNAEIATGTLDGRYYTEAELNGGQLNSLYFTESEITGGAADGRYYTETELDAGQLDNRYYTETELNAGQLDNRYYTETEAEARFLRQDSSETIASGATWSGSDAYVATTAAIDLRIIELVDDVGGFVPIASETSFPTANPDINTSGSAKGGTIVSVKTASTNLVPSGTTVTIANGRGSGLAVIITGVTATIPSGYGFLCETTATDHTYAFHRLVPKATEVATVAANAVNIAAAGANVTDISNFGDVYQISNSAPTARADSSSLAVGDLWFDSSSNKVMMVYDGSSGDGYSAITPNQSDLINIGIVAGQITYTEDLGSIASAVNTGSGNNSVNTVATSIANVNSVASAIANVNTVAADTTDIGAVAAKSTEIGRLGTAAAVADLAILGTTDVVSDLNTLATTAIVSDMDTLADISSNITTVAGIASNVTTVAGNNTNVSTAATNIASINTAASNISNVNNFTDKYQIASSNPSTDGGGNSLAAGDLYFSTSLNELRVYNGSSWQGGITSTGALLARSGGQMTGNITMSGSQTVDGRDLSADGSKLDGIEASATADQTASEIVALLSGQTIAPNVITTTNLTLDFGSIA